MMVGIGIAARELGVHPETLRRWAKAGRIEVEREVLKDVGSGVNDHKKGLRQLVKRIGSGEVGRLVITHKEWLLHFGSALVLSLCEHFGTEVVIINASEDASFEEELVEDVVEDLWVDVRQVFRAERERF